MTGDKSSAAIAMASRENVTVRLLTVEENKGKGIKREEGPTSLGGENKDRLPIEFETGDNRGQIVIEDVGKTGTKEAYDRDYKPFKKADIRPWRNESYRATEIVGEEYQKPQTRKAIEDVLLPSDSATRKKVKNYKKHLDQKNRILEKN